jgi:hypothetical protein
MAWLVIVYFVPAMFRALISLQTWQASGEPQLMLKNCGLPELRLASPGSTLGQNPVCFTLDFCTLDDFIANDR